MTGGGSQGGFPDTATPDTAIRCARRECWARRRGQNDRRPVIGHHALGPGRCSWAGVGRIR